jgi:hypothetical protein
VETATPRRLERRALAAETLPEIDAYFWDWTLWLGSKSLSGRTDLVRAELAKMHDLLLTVVGVDQPPATLAGAVAKYLVARGAAASRLGVIVDEELGNQVRHALNEAFDRPKYVGVWEHG